MTEAIERVFDHIDVHLEAHVAACQRLIRQPSISPQNVGVRECAEMLRNALLKLGCQHAALAETPGQPVVYGELWQDAPKTLLIYGMYDTQPVDDLAGWSLPPLEARLVEKPPWGRCIVARGSVNSKAPLQGFLNAVASIRAVEGKLPVNLLFVLEGEEELSSRHLPYFIDRYQEKLRRADAVLFPFALQDADGKALIWPGTKGILYFELECSGARWGRGPKAYDVHSSWKVILDSPAWRLTHALSTMTTPDGNTVTIDGFYDNVRPPREDEVALARQLAATWNPEAYTKLWQVDRFVDHESVEALVRRYYYEPTLNIDGIWGGYTGEGSKTVLPHKITAKLDCRLVPDQTPEEIEGKIRAHLDRRGYEDIELRRIGRGMWSQTGFDEPIVQAAMRAYRRLGVEPELQPRNVGFFPAYLFNGPPLRLPMVVAGLGHGGRPHSPDEYFVIDGGDGVAGLAGCEKSHAATLYEYADLTR